MLQKARPTPVSVSTKQKLKDWIRRLMVCALFVLRPDFGHLPVAESAKKPDSVEKDKKLGCRIPRSKRLLCAWGSGYLF